MTRRRSSQVYGWDESQGPQDDKARDAGCRKRPHGLIGGLKAHARVVRLDDGHVHVVEDGVPDAPAVVLIGNAAVSTTCWDPVIPTLAEAFHVIRVDLLIRGRSPSAGRSTDIVTLARWVAETLEVLGVSRVASIGHSSGCTVATALAEQRPDMVTGIALINLGPDPTAKIPERLLVRLSLTGFPGRLLWRMRTEATVRKAARTAFARPVDLPDAFIEHVMEISHRDFVSSMRAPLEYLEQVSLPDRLRALTVPVLVIFGVDDQRWRSSSAADYRRIPAARVEMLPGVGHTPMMEDPRTTGELLLDFASEVTSTS